MEKLCWFSYEYDRIITPPSLQQLEAGPSSLREDEEEESSADEPGLEIVEPSPEASPEAVVEPSPEAEEEDMLSDIPSEALSALTRTEFVSHMRPYVWVKYPSATSKEINSFINARWNLLKASKKMALGKVDR